MKKITLTLVILISIMVFTVSCSNKDSATKKVVMKEKMTKLIPGNTDFLFKLSSLAKIYKGFDINANSAYGKKRTSNGIEKMKKDVGFNLFSLTELKENGFATDKELGFTVSDIKLQEKNETPYFNGTLLIPVTDGKKALLKIEQALTAPKDNQIKFTVSKDGNLTVITNQSDSTKLYLALKENYLFAFINPASDAKEFAKTFLAGGTALSDQKSYKEVAAKIGSGEDIFVYADIKKIVARNYETLNKLYSEELKNNSTPLSGITPNFDMNLKYLKDYEGSGFSFNLTNSDFVLNWIVNLQKGSKVVELMKGIKFNKKTLLGMAFHPALLFSGAINFSEYYQLFVSAISETEKSKLDDFLAEINSSYGIDLKNDVIENLNGNIDFAIFDGASFSITNFNTMLTVGVKNTDKANEMLNKIYNSLNQKNQGFVRKETVEGVEAHVYMAVMYQIYVGVKNNTLIATIGKPMFEKALHSDIATGFYSKIKDNSLKNSINENNNLFYFNVDEILKAVENTSRMLGAITGTSGIDENMKKQISQFEYMIISGKGEDNSIIGQYKLKTKFKEPFFLGLEKIVQSYY